MVFLGTKRESGLRWLYPDVAGQAPFRLILTIKQWVPGFANLENKKKRWMNFCIFRCVGCVNNYSNFPAICILAKSRGLSKKCQIRGSFFSFWKCSKKTGKSKWYFDTLCSMSLCFPAFFRRICQIKRGFKLLEKYREIEAILMFAISTLYFCFPGFF